MNLNKLLESIFSSLQGEAVITQRLTYALHQGLRLLGWPGVLALALLVVCATTWGTAISSLQNQLLAIEEENHPSAVDDGVSEQQRMQRASDLAVYRETLPETPRPAILLGQIHGYAEQSGLRPNNTEFQIVTGDIRAKPSQLASVVVTLDATSGHETLIRFINTVLTEMPNSALEAISLKRANLTETALETQVRFRFFVKAP